VCLFSFLLILAHPRVGFSHRESTFPLHPRYYPDPLKIQMRQFTAMNPSAREDLLFTNRSFRSWSLIRMSLATAVTKANCIFDAVQTDMLRWLRYYRRLDWSGGCRRRRRRRRRRRCRRRRRR
jgi:hypothetical protein